MPTPYDFPQYVIDRVMQKRGKLTVYEHFEPKRTALLVIDMQNFYVGEIASVVGIIPNINRIAQKLRTLGGQVFWVGMTAGEGGKSHWPVYHDYFFTKERGAIHRDQLSPGTTGTSFMPRSISSRATRLFTRAGSHRLSRALPTSTIFCAPKTSTA